MARKLPELKFIIFSLIGVFNTLFDIAMYTLLRNLGQSVLIANLISVSIALVGSYFLNARFTFKNTVWTTKRFVGFVLVTLTGLWFLQTAVIYALQPLFQDIPASWWHHLGRVSHTAQIVTPKLVATGVTFMWNYLWYNKVIFKSANSKTPDLPLTSELY